MRIAEYYHAPQPPPVQALLAVAYAAVRDHAGRILLVRRTDDGNWELPGGRIDVGETVTAAVVREVTEEAGIVVEPTGVAGVFTDPDHIVVYAGEGARQQLAVCVHAVPRDETGDPPRPDHAETSAASWFEVGETATLPMHPAMRRRLAHAVNHPDRPHLD